MAKWRHRPQTSDLLDTDDLRPLIIKPLEHLDRLHNPKDIEPDTRAMLAGVCHGGMQDNHVQALAPRGLGGRKRSGAYYRSRAGRDVSKKR